MHEPYIKAADLREVRRLIKKYYNEDFRRLLEAIDLGVEDAEAAWKLLQAKKGVTGDRSSAERPEQVPR